MATCYPNQLAQTLQQSNPAVVLLWGDDAGAIRQAADDVLADWGVPLDDPFLSEKISLPDLQANPSRLPDSATTMALGGGRRLIRVIGLSGDEKATDVAVLTDAIKTTLAFPLEDVRIIIPLPRALEKKSPLVKTLETASNALVVRFYVPSARDMSEWLQNECQVAGKRLEGESLHLLTTQLGADREQARREVEKLILYVGDAPAIMPADVHASLSGAIPADVFLLAEAVASRNVAHTDKLITVLLHEGDDLQGAFSITLNALTKLKQAQALRASGATDQQLLQTSGKIRAPRQAQADYLKQVKAYPAARLANLAPYAVEAFTQARSGVLNPQTVLSRALLALAT